MASYTAFLAPRLLQEDRFRLGSYTNYRLCPTTDCVRPLTAPNYDYAGYRRGLRDLNTISAPANTKPTGQYVPMMCQNPVKNPVDTAYKDSPIQVITVPG
jgi:hypothetical protein